MAVNDNELTGMAESLVRIADQLDLAGVQEAAAHLDSAVRNLADEGVVPTLGDIPEKLEAERRIVLQAAAAALIRAADRLDTLKRNDLANDVDKAIFSLAATE